VWPLTFTFYRKFKRLHDICLRWCFTAPGYAKPVLCLPNSARWNCGLFEVLTHCYFTLSLALARWCCSGNLARCHRVSWPCPVVMPASFFHRQGDSLFAEPCFNNWLASSFCLTASKNNFADLKLLISIINLFESRRRYLTRALEIRKLSRRKCGFHRFFVVVTILKFARWLILLMPRVASAACDVFQHVNRCVVIGFST